jgi:hypothetical protein
MSERIDMEYHYDRSNQRAYPAQVSILRVWVSEVVAAFRALSDTTQHRLKCHHHIPFKHPEGFRIV